MRNYSGGIRENENQFTDHKGIKVVAKVGGNVRTLSKRDDTQAGVHRNKEHKSENQGHLGIRHTQRVMNE